MNLQKTLTDSHRPSKELLLSPLPVDAAERYTKELKRTMSDRMHAPPATVAASVAAASSAGG